MLLMSNPPKLVYDESGQLIEVILSAKDYRAYLQTVAAESDWESLPVYLQDAIDQMLIDEVRTEKHTVVDFDAVVSGKATGA
ncbi:MAG: hypothetical protein BroJett015_08320 [Chloroflexota bacterium]|nr:hypothetical protein [Ardenticatenaceae bacterium]GIK55169.1 MAG: hypothetical protein BroJett015_08320 [Chloroflexota bacterium]